MYKVFEQFPEKSLLHGVYLELGDHRDVDHPQMLVKMVTRGRRARLEVSPLVVPLIYHPNVFVPAFKKVLQIIRDPDGLEPARPPGHVHVEHMPSTYRWPHQGLRKRLRQIADIPDVYWTFSRDDGGSLYFLYYGDDGYTYMKQVAKSNGRTLVGWVRRVVLPTWHTRHGTWYDCPMVFDVAYRLVIKEGKGDRRKGYSRAGATNLDFVRFITEYQVPPWAIGYL